MKTIIAGGRAFKGYNFAYPRLDNHPDPITEIVSGGANGADRLGEEYAKANGIPVKQFPARWDLYGNKAGPLRNAEMAAYADALIAFWDGKSAGTRNMIERARRKGLRVTVHLY